MPSYLIDEGGERTHAVVPVEEYERLRSAFETLQTVRGYAHEMVSALDATDVVEEQASSASQVSHAQPSPGSTSPWSSDPSSRQRSDWSS